MTLKQRQIFHIHRLKDIGANTTSITRQMGLSRQTVLKYLLDPDGEDTRRPRKRSSKLDPFKDAIYGMVQQCEDVSAVVIAQRLREKGYDGGLTILKDYLRSKRGKRRKKRTFVHFESAPGEAMQVDWAHCGTLTYDRWVRPLYCFAMMECYSRHLYLEFTHSMKLEVFIDCHVGALKFFKGCSREFVIDNLKTAVIERDGKLIHFNDTYLKFLRRLRALPRACTPGAPHEKGKIEKMIDYIKRNFLPLRTFTDIEDVNHQARLWRDTVANVRVHETTGERPIDRFQRVTLQPIDAVMDYDSRQVLLTKGRQTLRVKFDCNYYSIPYWAAGKPLEVKASRELITIYHKGRRVAKHTRCWEKKKSIVNPAHREGIVKHKARISFMQEILLSMGEPAKTYLEAIRDASLPLKRTIRSLAELKDRFGSEALKKAMQISIERKVIGAEYVEQLLYQITGPCNEYPKVQLKNRPDLAQLRLKDVDLLIYDNILIEKAKENDDETG